MPAPTPHPRRHPAPLRSALALLAGLSAGALGVTACAAPLPEPEPLATPEGPIDLAGALELARVNNSDLRISRQRVLRAAELVDEADSMFWPTVTVGERFTRTNAPSRVFAQSIDQGAFSPGVDFNAPGTLSDYRAELSADVTLYDGGRRKARVAMSEARLGATVAADEEVRATVAYEVARAWHAVHAARVAQSEWRAAVRAADRLLELAEAELDAGAGIPTEVEELRVRRTRAVAGSATASDAARRAETALGILMGFGAMERFELREPELPERPPLPPLEELLERARFARPELVRAQREIEYAVAAVGEAEAGYWPELGVQGTFGFDDRRARLRHSDWLFGASLVENLTDALRTPGRVRRAAADLIVAHEAGRRMLLEVEGDVEAAWIDARDAERGLRLALQEERRASNELERHRAERDSGAGRPAALVAARLDADRARARLRAAQLRRELARLGVEHATGSFPPPGEPSEEEPTAGEETE